MKELMKNFILLKKSVKFFVISFCLLSAIYLITNITGTPFKFDTQAEGEIEIYSLEDLYAIRDDLSGSYILMNDLDFNNLDHYETYDSGTSTWSGDDLQALWTTGDGWDPIGTNYSSYFNGSFDGQEHTISNLYINRTGYPSGYYVGLFAYSKGTISNLNMDSVNVTGTTHVGGIVGYLSSGNITNCSLSGTSSFVATNYTGPLLGSNYSSQIVNSYYNYDTTLINGSNSYELGALEDSLYSSWISNNKTLDFSSYFDTDGEYYIIDTIEKFKLIRNFSTSPGIKFKLTTDLDLTSEPDVYISYFKGEFDGQNNEISNLSLNLASKNRLGLFGSISTDAVVKNIRVTNSTVTGNSMIGILAGENYGEIINSSSQGTVSGFANIGGLVGYNNTTVDYSYSESDVTSSEWNIGGLLGSNYGEVKNSYFLGSLTTGYGGDIGGLVGRNSTGLVYNSYYNMDTVTIDGTNMVTIGALGNTDFTNWLNNGRSLDPDDYLSYSNGYYQIDNLDDFKTLLALGQYPSLKFELNSDLDLTSESNFYIPYLSGEFEGNNHTISNFSYTITADKVSQVGLFGVLEATGVIRDLGVLDVDIAAGYDLGAVAGENRGLIEYCYSTGSITTNDWGEQLGGLVGSNAYGSFIRNSYSTVDIIGNYYAGGLVGTTSGTIENSYATGAVSGNGLVGGLTGYNSSTITNSYSTGLITDLDGYDYKFGGLVGSLWSGGVVTNSYWDTETSGRSSSEGGTPKTTTEMKDLSTFNTWDITSFLNFNPSDSSTWYIKDTEYPKLAMQFVGPEVETGTTSNITKTSATLSGTLSSLASESTVDVYFRYRETEGDWLNSTSLTRTSTGGYTIDIENLTPGTIYEYSSVVTWRDVGTDYGETLTFTTDPDLIPPTGEISINGNKTYSSKRSVTLSLNATDDLTGISQMIISNNSSFTDSSWETYNTSKSWTVTSGDGNKTVYVKFKDGAGNISEVYSDSIILHTPSVLITDIGLIDSVPDRDSLTYYFTSTVPKIKGTTQSNSTVSFEYDNETFTTQANSDGEFSITLTVDRGENNIEYYSTDVSGNSSVTKELILIVGTEYFPDWLLEKLGLIDPPEEEIEEEPIEDSEEEVEEDIEEEEDSLEENAVDENTPPTSNTRTIKFTDDRGNPLTKAVVEIEGKRYVTDSNGMIAVEGLEDRAYSAEIRTRDGKNYNTQILGAEQGDIVVEIEGGNSNIRFIYIFLFGGIGLLIIIILVVLMKKNKSNKEAF